MPRNNLARSSALATTQSIKLHVTKDYDMFKLLHGNRQVDKNHVARLKRKIENEGNLTPDFPVNLNDKMEVIDGQNRIMALKELGYPVFYTITPGANLSTVRQINVGRRNWTWTDYAQSYAAEGNVNYKDLLDFHEAFGFGHRTLMIYTSGGKGVDTEVYQTGDFKVLDRGMTFGLLTQLSEIRDAIPFGVSTPLASAMYDIMTHPAYDHKRMLNKLTKYGTQLHEWRLKKDWLRNLEDIYNIGQTEDTRVRFF